MRLYDSRRRRVEPFSAPDGRVRVYVCGVTPYDTTHLGHAFTYVVFDVLGRNLRRHGLAVTYVQNVTDVDDDLLERARQTGRDWRELTAANVAIFRADLEALNIVLPDQYPYASQEVGPIGEMIGRLLERGYAYRADGNVYFRIARFPAYGELSGYSREQMIALSAERGADPNDPRKEDALDFILWQQAAPDEPTWEMPWGAGRPGWHIECSAMCYRYLGEQVDIHGGGGDLVYPHHESEIAQSESFTGRQPFARFWMHVGMLRYEGQKMSKSLGNMLFVRKLRRDYSADAIRLGLLNHAYRDSFDFDRAELDTARELAERLAAAVAERADGPGDERAGDQILADGLAALDNDLDTPGAIAALGRLLELPPSEGRRRGLRELGGVLGLTFRTVGR